MNKRIQAWCWLSAVLLIALPALAADDNDQTDQENLTAAAYTDFPLLGSEAVPAIGAEHLRSIPYDDLLKPFDINQDLSLNDFDVKQFQSIIDSLNGSELTGLQLAARFRNIQKNQKESFLALYDLDRDGYFSFKDVNLFTGVIDSLDESGTKGKELVHKYQLKLSPPEHPSSRSNS